MRRSLHKGLGTGLRHLFPSCHTKSKRERQKVCKQQPAEEGSIKALPASSNTRRHQANYEKDFSELTLGSRTTTTPCSPACKTRAGLWDRRADSNSNHCSGSNGSDNEKSDEKERRQRGIWPLGVTWVHPGVVLVCNRRWSWSWR